MDRYEFGVAGEDEPVSTEADGSHDCFGVVRRRLTHTHTHTRTSRAELSHTCDVTATTSTRPPRESTECTQALQAADRGGFLL